MKNKALGGLKREISIVITFDPPLNLAGQPLYNNAKIIISLLLKKSNDYFIRSLVLLEKNNDYSVTFFSQI
jgi:hypothetical protein